MSKLYDTQTKRYVTVATALRNGLIKEPARFEIPRGKVIIPTKKGREMVTTNKATKLLKESKIKLSQILGSYDNELNRESRDDDVIIPPPDGSNTLKTTQLSYNQRANIKSSNTDIQRYVLTPNDKRDPYAFYEFLKRYKIEGKGKFIVAQNGRVITEVSKVKKADGDKLNQDGSQVLLEVDLDITLPLSKWWKENNGHLIGMIDSKEHAWIYSDSYEGDKLQLQTPYHLVVGDKNKLQYVPKKVVKNTSDHKQLGTKGELKHLLSDSKKTVTVFYWSPDVNLPSKKINQTFRQATNNSCFFDVIEQFLNNKVETDKNATKHGIHKKLDILCKYRERYPEGMPEKDIQSFADDIKLNFEINDVLNNSMLTYKAKRANKTSNTVRFLNSRFNHVEKNLFIDNGNNIIEIDTQEEMVAMFNALVKEKQPFYYTGQQSSPRVLYTQQATYKFKSEINEVIKSFNFFIEMDKFRLDYKNDYHVCRFIHYGVNYNAHCAFNELSKYTVEEIEAKNGKFIEYDLRAAYTRWLENRFYVGFPTYMMPYIKLENWTVANCKKYVGYYKVQVKTIKDDNVTKILEELGFCVNSEYVLTSPEILFFDAHGVTFDFFAGSYSLKSQDIELTPDMKKGIKTNKYGDWFEQKPYAIWAGKLNSINKISTKKTVCDVNMAQVLSSNYESVSVNYGFNDKRGEEDYVCDAVECKINYEKSHVYWYGHIGGFITAYTRTLVLDSLLKINHKRIIGFKLDGFIVKGNVAEIDLDIKRRGKDNELWTIKDTRANFNWGMKIYDPLCLDLAEGYMNSIYDNDAERINNDEANKNNYHVLDKPLFKKRVSLLAGMGGAGKTYDVMSRFKNVLYVCANWALIADKVVEYPGVKGITYHQLLGINCEEYTKRHNVPSIIFIDEITQIDENYIKQIIKKCPYSKIFLAGDVDESGYYQCEFKDVNVISNFNNIEIIKYTNNYRCKDPELLKRLNNLRECMRDCYFNNTKVNEHVMENFKDRKISVEELKKMYNYKTDWILCSTTDTAKESQTKHYSDMFEGNKYLCTSHTRTHIYKRLAGENIPLKGNVVIDPKKEDLDRFEKRHAYTIHSFQGVTVKNPSKLFIDSKKIFSSRQMYTAISRVEYLDQIYII